MERLDTPVTVRYMGFASYADLAPVLDEFRELFWAVDASVRTPDFSGRGGAIHVPLDLVFDAARFIGEAAVAGIIGTLAMDGSKKLRKAILQFWDRYHEKYQGNKVSPLGIHVGSLWLIYNVSLTDEEFQASLEGAQRLSTSLPNLESGEFIGQYFWDPASQNWQGPFRP